MHTYLIIDSIDGREIRRMVIQAQDREGAQDAYLEEVWACSGMTGDLRIVCR